MNNEENGKVGKGVNIWYVVALVISSGLATNLVSNAIESRKDKNIRDDNYIGKYVDCQEKIVEIQFELSLMKAQIRLLQNQKKVDGKK